MDLKTQQTLALIGVTVWQLRDPALKQDAEQADVAGAAVSQVSNKTAELVAQQAGAAKAGITMPANTGTADPVAGNTEGSGVESLNWEELQAAVAACQACQLAKTRKNTVFGSGNAAADLLIVGEAPGAEEDRQGLPFVGRAGQLLTEMLLAIGLQREQVFIANTLKCRPPNNRDPQIDEVLQCQPYLLRQVALIKPKLILALGRIAAHNVLQTDLSLARLRGKQHEFMATGIPVYVSYHPAYLLRAPQEKARAWQDLQVVARLLEES